MKVAFATDDGQHVNSHFGYANRFEVYDITSKSYEKLQTRPIMHQPEESENGRIENRLNAVLDCTLLFVTQIGPAAAARVTRNQILPIKVDENVSIQSQLDRLLTMLRTKPPVWLVKAMNNGEKVNYPVS